MRPISLGRAPAGTRVLILAHDLQVTIINAATGELLRELTIDTTRDYQPTGRPKGPQKRRKPPNQRFEGFLCPETSHGGDGGI